MSLVRKNIFVLFLIQGTNYIFPLLTIPYLSRIFGPTGIGALALAQATILYLTLVVDFGFNLTVTRRISIAFEKKNFLEINQLYTQTLIIKFSIFLLVALFMLILCQFVPQLDNIKVLILIGFISLLGSVLNPIWLFQGIQRMGMLLIPTTLSKLISLVLIFIFVKSSQDLNWAMFFTSLGMFLSAIVSLYYIRQQKLAHFCQINLEKSINLVQESFYIFLSYLGSSVYTTMNTFIMSFFVGLRDIGIYSSADKVVMTAQSLMSPIHQAIFPNLSSFSDKNEYLNKFKKYGVILFSVASLISVSLFFLSKIIVLILFGKEFYESYKILQILSPLPLIISLGVIFGQWGLIAIGESKILGKIYLIAGLLHLSYIFILLKLDGIYGAAISIVLTESLVSMFLSIFFFKKIKTWGGKI